MVGGGSRWDMQAVDQATGAYGKERRAAGAKLKNGSKGRRAGYIIITARN